MFRAMFEDSGPRNHSDYGFRNEKPRTLGTTWTPWVTIDSKRVGRWAEGDFFSSRLSERGQSYSNLLASTLPHYYKDLGRICGAYFHLQSSEGDTTQGPLKRVMGLL